MSASRASRTWSTASDCSKTSECTGRPDSAANVSAPTNRWADGVMTTWTSAPHCVSNRRRWAALYAAIPPVTPSRTRRSPSGPATPPGTPALLGLGGFQPLEADLALGDLLEGDGERLGPQALHQGRDELPAAFAKLAVVGVDLAGPLGGQDHQRIPRVDLVQQLVDLGLDHVKASSPWVVP